MRIELQARGAVIDGLPVPLTRSEQALLAWLIAHPGVPQSRETLLTRVWGYSPGARSRTVDATMNRLRSKLEEAGATTAIRTVRGRGWAYEAAETPGARPFVGRVVEQDALARWLAGDGALLTVTGEPGVGKTALVERVARDRVRRVDADGLNDAADWFREVEAVRRGEVLWVDGADLRVDLLRAVLPGRKPLRLIVTCRRRLGLPAEEILRLQPLSNDDAASLAPGIPAPDGEDAEGNPLALTGDRAAIARAVERSLVGLHDEERAALQRLAALPVPVPPALAQWLAGGPGVLDALVDGSLVHRGSAEVRVPAVVRWGLGSDHGDAKVVEAILEQWVLEHVDAVRRDGDSRWLRYLRDLDAEIGVLAWVARHSTDLRVIEVAVAALDDRHLMGMPDSGLGELHDRAVAMGGVEGLMRRASWRQRTGDLVGAEADREALLRVRSGELGPEEARAALAGAMTAVRRRQLDVAEERARQSLAWGERAGERRIEAMSRFVLAEVALDRGDPAGALAQARAARTVPMALDRAGHTLTSFLGMYLHEAGYDDEARESVAESRRIAEALGFEEGVAFSDALLAWMDVVTTRDRSGIERLQASCVAMGTASIYWSGTYMRQAWAEIVAGSPERGLSMLRTILRDELHPRVGDVIDSRAFAVAARIRLGLPPRAPWMVPEDQELDPAVRALVRGLEAAAIGDLTVARAMAAEIRSVPTSRVRALRWVLGDLIRHSSRADREQDDALYARRRGRTNASTKLAK